MNIDKLLILHEHALKQDVLRHQERKGVEHPVLQNQRGVEHPVVFVVMVNQKHPTSAFVVESKLNQWMYHHSILVGA